MARTVSFLQGTSRNLEAVGAVQIPVSISEPGPLESRVDYAVTGGTAGASDFVLPNGTLVVPPEFIGTKEILLTIVNDATQELNETVEITLSNPVNCVLGATTWHVSKIVDDDGGLYRTKKPEGANHERAHDLALGFNTRVGVIELLGPGGSKGIIRSKCHIDEPRIHLDQDFTAVTACPVSADQPTVATPTAEHATLVADIIASSDSFHTGVAKACKIAAAHISGFVNQRAAIDWLYRQHSVFIVNESLGAAPNDSGNNAGARFIDWFARTRDVVFITSAGNGAPQLYAPADAFNNISVGAVGQDLRSRASYSAYRLSGDPEGEADKRCKPEILAPGGDPQEKMSNGEVMDHGTSFAAPHVAGVCALLASVGLGLGDPGQSNHLAQKAIILNSARKRYIAGENSAPPDGFPFSRDNAATANEGADGDYLTAAGTIRAGVHWTEAPKTAEWTPSRWYGFTDGTGYFTYSSLDDEQGAGVLDANRAMLQYLGGNQPPGITITFRGWHVGSLAPGGSALFPFIGPLTRGSFLTVTLVWDRIIDRKFQGIIDNGPTPPHGGPAGEDEYIDHVGDLGFLPNFNLFVDKVIALVSRSDALGGAGEGLNAPNVEHLHSPVPEDGDDYRLRVELVGSGPGSFRYAIAWWVGSGA